MSDPIASDPHPEPVAPSGREAARMSVERWARLCDDYACEGACTSPHAEDAAVVAECLTEIRLLRDDVAARDAQVGERAGQEARRSVAVFLDLLSRYGPVPHQAGCSGGYRPNLEKCGADRLNAALTAFWEGHPDAE